MVSTYFAPYVLAVEVVRLKLADLIFGLAKNGNFEPKQLADTAVQLILASQPGLRRQS
jgi:hypothetical protein